MGIKVYRPQLKSDCFININPKFALFLSAIMGFFCWFLFYSLLAYNIVFCAVVSIFLFVFSYFLMKRAAKIIKLWDMKGPAEIKIDTNTKDICFDNSVKFNINQIDYVEINEYEPPSKLRGIKTYYSVINGMMKFHLKNNEILDFPIQNTSNIIQIIKLLRELGAEVKTSETEEEFEGTDTADKLFAIFIFVIFIILFLHNMNP